jgi:hypothetical protein
MGFTDQRIELWFQRRRAPPTAPYALKTSCANSGARSKYVSSEAIRISILNTRIEDGAGGDFEAEGFASARAD